MLAHFGPNLQLPWNRDTVSREGVRSEVSGKRMGRVAHLGRTYLGKVFADVIGGRREIVAKGASVSRLAGALAEEFARNVGSIYDARALDQCAGLARATWHRH